MIYRIAIKENGKFVRYADESEIADGSIVLMPNGKVYISVDVPVPKDDPLFSLMGYTKELKDASATHEVEWGVELNGKQYYHNDILASLCTLTSYDPRGTLFIAEYDNETASFWAKSVHDSEIQFSVLCPELDKMLTVVGNLNENPELLRAQEEA